VQNRHSTETSSVEWLPTELVSVEA
jgi:hypothetical protein